MCVDTSHITTASSVTGSQTAEQEAQAEADGWVKDAEEELGKMNMKLHTCERDREAAKAARAKEDDDDGGYYGDDGYGAHFGAQMDGLVEEKMDAAADAEEKKRSMAILQDPMVRTGDRRMGKG